MINRTVLTGRLTKDPQIANTNNGTPYCNFTLAVDRQFRNKQGERDADFIRCVIWRKAAQNFANFTHKGALVGIDGRIQTRSYQDNNGNRVYITEVAVDNFALLEPRRNNRYSNNGGYNQQQAPQLRPDQVPSNGYQNNGYQNNQQNNQSNGGPQYRQGQLNTNQGTSWENTGAGQKVSQMNDQDLPFPQNAQNGSQSNSGNRQGNYPNGNPNANTGQKGHSNNSDTPF